MMKVEAVVVRDRVETVMEAVEAATGHVGVDRHRSRRSRPREGHHARVPGPRLRVAVPAESAHDVHRPRRARERRRRRDRRRGADGARERRRDLLDVARRARHPQPDRSQARGGRDGMSTKELGIRGEHDLGDHRGRPRHLHAGRLRVPRGGPDPDEERRPHRGQERAHPRDRVDRLLLRRLRDGLRRRRHRLRRRLGLLPDGRRAAHDRAVAVLVVQRRSRARPATCSRSRSPPCRSRSSGARWRSARSCGCTSPSARSSP